MSYISNKRWMLYRKDTSVTVIESCTWSLCLCLILDFLLHIVTPSPQVPQAPMYDQDEDIEVGSFGILVQPAKYSSANELGDVPKEDVQATCRWHGELHFGFKKKRLDFLISPKIIDILLVFFRPN